MRPWYEAVQWSSIVDWRSGSLVLVHVLVSGFCTSCTDDTKSRASFRAPSDVSSSTGDVVKRQQAGWLAGGLVGSQSFSQSPRTTRTTCLVYVEAGFSLMKMNCNWISSWPKSNYLRSLIGNFRLHQHQHSLTPLATYSSRSHYRSHPHPQSEYRRTHAVHQIGHECEMCAHSVSVLRSSSWSANQECCQDRGAACTRKKKKTDDLEINFSASFISYSQHISSIITILLVSFQNGWQKSFVATFGKRHPQSSSCSALLLLRCTNGWGRWWWCRWNDVGMLSHLFRSTFQSSSFTLFILIVSPAINSPEQRCMRGWKVYFPDDWDC